ncbi:hypothetical protein OAS39_00335 [Pirellulales bacterium]|nr:hypothetical protein [Pirellulales bacterium]
MSPSTEENRVAGKKKGRRKRSPVSDAGDLAIAERELAKGNAKDALKLARVAYRRDPAEPTTALLKKALLRRTQNLYERRLHSQARALISELNSLSIDDPEMAGQVQRLNVLLGAGNSRAQVEFLSADPALFGELIDAAVLSGDAAPCPSELIPEIESVRDALRAVSEKNDSEAIDAIHGIGRTSPVADWKLFIRGLIAFYERDDQRRDANWSRLAPQRSPARIARSLERGSGIQAPSAGEAPLDSGREAAARTSLDAPAARLLRQVQGSLQEGGRWTVSFGSFLRHCRESDPELVVRVAEILLAKFIKDRDVDQFEALMRLKPPCRFDPHFLRAEALFDETNYCVEDVVDSWEKYANYLPDCSEISPSERMIARSLVYLHVGRLCADEAAQLAGEQTAFAGEIYQKANQLRADNLLQRASKSFLASQEFDPQNRAAYAEHCAAVSTQGEIERANAEHRKFADQFPDDFEAQLAAARHFRYDASMPAEAQEYLKKAEKLRPRNSDVGQMYWESALDAAQAAARTGRRDEAAAQLDLAERYLGLRREGWVLAAMRAAIVQKFDGPAAADQFLEAARSDKSLAPAITFAYCVCAFLCGVSNERRAELNDQLKEVTAARRPASNVAGAIARFLIALDAGEFHYHGQNGHQKLVVAYLKRCPKKDWAESDLNDAISYLLLCESNRAVLKHLSQIGSKRRPDNPWPWIGLGVAEMDRGPRRCNRRRAISYFSKAIELNQNSPKYPLDTGLLSMAGQSLELLEMPAAPLPVAVRPPADVDADVALPPEFLEVADAMGLPVDELISAFLAGEAPEEFLDRYGVQVEPRGRGPRDRGRPR